MSDYGYHTKGEEIVKSSIHNIKGKYFIVTGTTAGLGLETAGLLLKAGGIVTCACRNTTFMEEQIGKWKKEGLPEEATAHVIKCDLGEFKSIREFAEAYTTRVGQLDVLVNNAGWVGPFQKTKDDYEMTMGTNHLGHYLLTGLLQELLLKSEQPRVVNVSSKAYENVKENIVFDDFLYEKKEYSAMGAYSMSKLANIYFSRGIAKRLGGKVKSFSLHPGVIQTEIFRNANCCLQCLIVCLGTTFCIWKSTGQGVATQIMAAVSDKVNEIPNGSYLDDCKYVSEMKVKLTDEQENELFEWSEKITGVKINN